MIYDDETIATGLRNSSTVSDFVSESPEAEQALTHWISRWLGTEVDNLARRRYKRGPPSDKVTIHPDLGGNIRGINRSDGNIRLWDGNTCPAVLVVAIHERLHSYSSFRDHTARRILDQRRAMFKEWAGWSKPIKVSDVNGLFRDMSHEGYNSLVESVMTEYISYTDTPYIMERIMLPYAVSVEQCLEFDSERFKRYSEWLDTLEKEASLMNPGTFQAMGFNAFLRNFYSLLRKEQDLDDGIRGKQVLELDDYLDKHAISSIATPFANFARLHSVEISTTDTIYMDSTTFAERYNEVVRAL